MSVHTIPPTGIRGDRDRRTPGRIAPAGWGAALFLAACLRAAQPELPGTLANFVACVRAAALVDPATGHADEQEIRDTRLRQRHYLDAVEAAAEGAGKPRLLPETKPGEIHRLMHNVRILRLTSRERDRWTAACTAYAHRLSTGFAPALERMLPGAANRDLRDRIMARWNSPLAVSALYFTDGSPGSSKAFYVPVIRTVFLDLNASVDDPAGLSDGLEHELWHHLLPVVTPYDVGRNLWWEGFNEAVSECWAEGLPRDRDCPAEGPVLYPVLTAYASLFLACDLPLTLRWLDGELGREAYAERLRQAPRPGLPGLPDVLADSLLAAEEMPAPREQRVAHMLTAWGWKEDDGSPVQVDIFTGGGRVDRAACSRVFAENRRFAFAFLDALTVTLLQDAVGDLGQRRLLRVTPGSLPENLHTNLKRTLHYAADPKTPLH